MELKGFVKGLRSDAFKAVVVKIPKNTLIKVYDVNIDALAMLDRRMSRSEGQVSQADLEAWKQQGGPHTSFVQTTTTVAKKDLEIHHAALFNGNVAHKILFHAVFGEDKAVLFEEQGESYVLSNPMVAWRSPDSGMTYVVDATDVPDIVNGILPVTGTPIAELVTGEVLAAATTETLTKMGFPQKHAELIEGMLQRVAQDKTQKL